MCRRELPAIDEISKDYADRVAFVAPAWQGTLAATSQRASELLTSGNVVWGLDADEQVFRAYGVPYQPVTVLIGADKTVVEVWAGAKSDTEVRASLDNLLAVSG